MNCRKPAAELPKDLVQRVPAAITSSIVIEVSGLGSFA